MRALLTGSVNGQLLRRAGQCDLLALDREASEMNSGSEKSLEP
jgi:hypothetical protein